jgi:hypothetical protein
MSIATFQFPNNILPAVVHRINIILAKTANWTPTFFFFYLDNIAKFGWNVYGSMLHNNAKEIS